MREWVTVFRHRTRLTRPQAIFWDLDGTLVDSEKLWDISLAELARELGGELAPAVRAAMVGSALDRTLDLMFAAMGRHAGPDERDRAGRWLTERTRQLFAAGLPWRPGAWAALRAVREAGIAATLVTSTHRSLTELALRSIGPEHFDVTVCGDEVTHTKPHPDPYLRAAAALGVDPAGCVAVEDSPTGTASAVAAGCTVLVVPSEVPVAAGERRVLRDSLVGVDAELLGSLLPADPVPFAHRGAAGWDDGTS
ncbi:MAG TPA: HAD family phosphatase [Pseudonocardiaceae bacterium]|jgi:HAD superfamily hydrolase (TIGR01509 family)|nr:HAD family phosphatase [Pseudonocardiaceae bacterium]